MKRKGKSLVSGAREENAGYGLDPPFRVWSEPYHKSQELGGGACGACDRTDAFKKEPHLSAMK